MARPKKRKVAVSKRERRLHELPVVRELARFFVDDRPTVFAHSSAARHGLRATMCLDGLAWAEAERRAGLIVQFALLRIGARYPSWSMGQPLPEARTYTWCRQCHGRLDDDAASPFCSFECYQADWARTALLARAGDAEAQAIAGRLWRANGAAIYVSPEPLRTCRHCGTLFRLPRGGEGKYCSQRCSARAVNRGETVPCAVCDRPFQRIVSTALTCGPVCSRALANQRRRVVAPAVLKPRPCAHCGTLFAPRRYSTERYCSHTCIKRAYKLRQREAAAVEKREQPPTPKTCVRCGASFEARAGSRALYCGPTCNAAAYRERKAREELALAAD